METTGDLLKALNEATSESLMKKNLTSEIQKKLKNKKTTLGGTLGDCIRSGIVFFTFQNCPFYLLQFQQKWSLAILFVVIVGLKYLTFCVSLTINISITITKQYLQAYIRLSFTIRLSFSTECYKRFFVEDQ